MFAHALALAMAVILNASANLLLKFAAKELTAGQGLMADGLGNAIITAITCPKLVLGLLFFALNVPLYFIALGKFNVSVAYPIMFGGGFAIIVSVASLSFFGLNENLTASQWVGIALILAGLIIVTHGLANQSN